MCFFFFYGCLGTPQSTPTCQLKNMHIRFLMAMVSCSLPGHVTPVSHCCSSFVALGSSWPSHLPPWRGAGLVQDRVRLWVPVSQVAEQSSQSVQSVQLPGTKQIGFTEYNFFVISTVYLGRDACCSACSRCRHPCKAWHPHWERVQCRSGSGWLGLHRRSLGNQSILTIEPNCHALAN